MQCNKLRNAMGALALAGFMAACSGGSATGSGSTTTRTLTGSVSSDDPAALVKSQTTASCAADEVIATSVDGDTTTASVDADCNFSLTLNVGESYSIGFLNDDTFVASLIFNTGISGFTGTNINIGSSGDDIDLGGITITGNVAIAENDPLDQIDSDDDGSPDLDDSDDDGDGIEDEDEDDCDLDGIWDDFEDDDSCEDDDSGLVKVREVKPRNDPQPEHGNDRVDLDKDVRARIACRIDTDSVTSETFSVVSADGEHTVDCTYTFNSERNHVECEHDSDDFLPDTVYTATLSGVMCENGSEVQERSWTWLTEESDDDEGSSEDDSDDDHGGGTCEEDDLETDDSCGASDDDDTDEDDDDNDDEDDSDDDDSEDE